MADPIDPSPPLWRRVAEVVGVDDDIDALSGAARSAGDWIQSKLPQPSPEAEARWAQIERERSLGDAEMARRSQANWESISGPVKRFFGSAPVQQFGHDLYEGNKHLWTPSPETTAMADMARQSLAERSNAVRAAMPKLPVTFRGGETGPLRGLSATVDPLKPLDWMAAAQND